MLVALSVLSLSVLAIQPSYARTSRDAASYLLSGVITDNGKPLTDAYVTVEAWPNADYLDAMRPDQTVPTKTLAEGGVDANGHYAFLASASAMPALPSTYFGSDGTVTLETDIQSASANAYQQFTSSAALSANAYAAIAHSNPDIAIPTSRPERIDYDLGSGAITTVLGDRTTHTTTAPGIVPALEAAPAVGTPTLSCDSYKFASKVGVRPERFMRFWATKDGVAHVNMTTESSHTLGIALSWDGGAWHADGSVTQTTDSAASANSSFRHDYSVANRLNYNRVKQTCCVYPNGSKCFNNFKAMPGKFHDLLNPDLTKAIYDFGFPHKNRSDGTPGYDTAYCTRYPYTPGNSYTKTTGAGSDYGAGVSLGFVSVEASASFSHQTSITFVVQPGSVQWLCGTTTQGWVSSPEVGMEYTPAKPCRGSGPCYAIRPSASTGGGDE